MKRDVHTRGIAVVHRTRTGWRLETVVINAEKVTFRVKRQCAVTRYIIISPSVL